MAPWLGRATPLLIKKILHEIMKEKVKILYVCSLFFAFLSLENFYSEDVSAQTSTKSDSWPNFGLVFQSVKDFSKAAPRYPFYWGTQQTASQLNRAFQTGVYVPAYNLVRTCRIFSELKYGPNFDYIATKHPDWFMRYKDGSLVIAGRGDLAGPRLDLGNSSFVEYAIDWVRKQAFESDEPVIHLGFDNAMFMYADSQWAKYDTNEAYRAVWESFVRKLSGAFRPQHKIILNVGGCDLNTFVRIIRYVDGVLQEDLCTPLNDPSFDPEKVRQLIRDRWQKGRWCADNGKIWAVRYRSTVNALELALGQDAPSRYLSVGDREILLRSPDNILGRISFSNDHANILKKVANLLQDYQIKATIVNPYPESSPLNNLQYLPFTSLSKKTTLKLKQAPREAFLFGYVTFLMVAGPSSFFVLGDERHREYYFEEMDSAVGAPITEMYEIQPNVFQRDFEMCSTILNISEKPYTLGDGSVLMPWRGAIKFYLGKKINDPEHLIIKQR